MRTRIAVASSIALLTFCAACGRKTAALTADEAAIVPGANLLVSVNMDAMRAAPIHARLAKLLEQQKESAAGQREEFEILDQLFRELQKSTGLTLADVSRLLFSANLAATDEVDMASATMPDAALAIRLSRSLPFAKLEDAMRRALAAMDEDTPMQMKTITHKNTPLVLVRPDKAEYTDETKALAIAVGGGDRLVLIAPLRSMREILDRGTVAEPAPGLKNLTTLAGGAHIQTLFALSDEMKEMVQEQALEASQGGGMEGMMANAAKTLEALTLTVTLDTHLRLAVSGVLGSEDAAQELRTALDTMVLPMVKMGLAMATGGKPLPMLETLKAEVVPGNAVRLGIAVGDADLDVLQAALAAQTP